MSKVKQNYVDPASGKPFRIVDAKAYVTEAEAAGRPIATAEKKGRVLARMGRPGEELAVYSQGGTLESMQVVQEGSVLLTKAGEDGKPIVDEHGHENTWQVAEATFRKKYEVPGGPIQDGMLAKPAGGPQKFMRVDEDIAVMVPWGEGGAPVPLAVEAGGWLNVTDRNDIYGVSARDFSDTYGITSGRRPAGPSREIPDVGGMEGPDGPDAGDQFPL